MHVVEFTYSWPAETFIVRHAEALAQVSGLRLTIATKSPIQADSASIREVRAFPHPVVNLPNFDQMSPFQKAISAAQTLSYRAPAGEWRTRDKAILHALTQLNPDLVHFHFGGLAIMLARYVRALGIPYTVSLRGSDTHTEPLRSEEYTRKLCQTLLDARRVHAVCDSIADEARRICPPLDSITTIRTCLPLEEMNAMPQPTSGGLRFITVGRLFWPKAYHDLIRAMDYLPDATLHIIGDGEEHDHLLYLIHQLRLQSRVSLCGKLPYEQFEALLKNATAYVQSSIAEGFSNSVAEAMALGKAIFATPAGGTAEVIRDGENGILLTPGDSESMAQMLAAARDMNRMQRLGSAARETALSEFGMSRHAHAFKAFFEQALAT